jgi:hypothetical protein
VVLVMLVLLAVAARGLFASVTRITFEDAYISLRYAENLARGLGMVYNPGERVFGASTPLYVGLLAGLIRLHLPALVIAKLLCVAADGLTLWLWGSWLLRRTGGRWAPVGFGLLFGLSPLMVQVSVSGMETSLALLALSGALLAALEGRMALCGCALGVLLLLRPDGLLAGGVILGLETLRARRVPWAAAGIAALIAAPWVVGATLYYGTPIPHSIPAKLAAYNLHRPSWLPNAGDTLAHLAPFRLPAGRIIANLALFPCVVLGAAACLRDPRLRVMPVLAGAWWAYLVFPRTLLFEWYYPPLVLPAYVLGALGLDALARARWTGRLRWAARLRPAPVAPVFLAVGMLVWLGEVGLRKVQVQEAEVAVRERIGMWLRAHTPPDARVAMEPIGYIGYYSGRRILDEVGLVSPEMVPLNREGAGWFPEMLRRYRPDYVVERPGYLICNMTLNSGVPIFRAPAERERFLQEYEPVATFEDLTLPRGLLRDYRFVIYARRGAAEARLLRETWARLDPERRERLLLRSLAGPAPAPLRPTAEGTGAAEDAPPRHL